MLCFPLLNILFYIVFEFMLYYIILEPYFRFTGIDEISGDYQEVCPLLVRKNRIVIVTFNGSPLKSE